MAKTILRGMVTLVDPANSPSRKALLVWALAAAIPWTLIAVAQVVWCVLDPRLGWLQAAAAMVSGARQTAAQFSIPAAQQDSVSWLRYNPLSLAKLATIAAAVGVVCQTGVVAVLDDSRLAQVGLDAAERFGVVVTVAAALAVMVARSGNRCWCESSVVRDSMQ